MSWLSWLTGRDITLTLKVYDLSGDYSTKENTRPVTRDCKFNKDMQKSEIFERVLADGRGGIELDYVFQRDELEFREIDSLLEDEKKNRGSSPIYKCIITKQLPSEMKDLEPELQKQLKANHLTSIAPALKKDGIQTLKQLSMHEFDEDAMPETHMVIKGSNLSKNRLKSLGTIHKMAKEEEEISLYSKANQRIIERYKSQDSKKATIMDSMKYFEKFMEKAEEGREKIAKEGLINRQDQEAIAKDLMTTALDNDLNVSLPTVDLSGFRSVEDFDRKLRILNASFMPKELRSAKDMVNLSGIFKGIYIDQNGHAINNDLISWKLGLEANELELAFQWPSEPFRETTSEMMTQSSSQTVDKEIEKQTSSFSKNASASGAFFAGAGIGYFSASGATSGAENKENHSESSNANGSVTQFIVRTVKIPCINIVLDDASITLAHGPMKEIRHIMRNGPENWDSEILDFFKRYGTHVSVKVTLGVARTYGAKATFSLSDTEKDRKNVLVNALDNKTSVSGGGVNPLGMGTASGATNTASNSTTGSASENKVGCNDTKVHIDDRIIANETSALSQTQTGGEFKKMVEEMGNSCWTVLDRYHSHGNLKPVWELLRICDGMDDRAKTKSFRDALQRVYVRDVIGEWIEKLKQQYSAIGGHHELYQQQCVKLENNPNMTNFAAFCKIVREFEGKSNSSPKPTIIPTITDPFTIIAIGNPGCGKSTTLNYLAQKVVFKSGIAIGSGLTSILDECTVGNITFKDTPGLNDTSKIKEAGKEISKALKIGGKTKILFFVGERSGRTEKADVTTMNLVLDAAPEIDNNYGVIVSKIDPEIAEMLKCTEHWATFLAGVFSGKCKKPCATENVQGVLMNDNAKNKKDYLVPRGEFKTLDGHPLENFIFSESLPIIDLTPNLAQEIDTACFEKKQEEIDELMKKDQSNKANIERLKKEVEEAKEKQGMWNGIGMGLKEFFKAPHLENPCTCNPMDLDAHCFC